MRTCTHLFVALAGDGTGTICVLGLCDMSSSAAVVLDEDGTTGGFIWGSFDFSWLARVSHS